MRASGMDISSRPHRKSAASIASTKSTDSDSNVHPLLKQYFDTAGDVMVLRGRLEDLDAERAERLSRRQLLQDQGAPLAITDEEFAKEYFGQRTKLQNSLESTQTRAEALRSKCERDGFDVEKAKWRLPDPSIVPSSPIPTTTASTSTAAILSLSDRTSVSNRSPVHGQARQNSNGRPALDLYARFERLRPTSQASTRVNVFEPILVSSGPTDAISTRTESNPANMFPALSRTLSNGEIQGSGASSAEPTTVASSQHRTIFSASKSTPTLLSGSGRSGGPAISSSSTSLTSSSLLKRRVASVPNNKQTITQSAVNNTTGFNTTTDYKRVQGTDSVGTHYDLEYGPPDHITDPDLRKAYGVYARKRVAGTCGDAELLDSSFHIPPRPQKFFRQGRVFAILWAEPTTGSDSVVTNITFNKEVWQGVHAKVRKFVVIRSMEDYCSAIPITTNDGKGASGPGVKKSDFAVIHTSKIAPPVLPEEKASREEAPMRHMSIHVDPDHREFSLDPLSRLNFGKVYTVDYNVKVKSIGMVSRGSMRGLLYQFRDVWKPAFTPPKFGNILRSLPDIADITETSSHTKPLSDQEQRDSARATNGQPLKADPRLTPDSPQMAKPSLNNEASSAVDRLLERGHSVDQILSAFDGKRSNQDRMLDMGSSDDVW